MGIPSVGGTRGIICHTLDKTRTPSKGPGFSPGTGPGQTSGTPGFTPADP